MGTVLSLDKARTIRAERILKSADSAFCGRLLQEATALVRKHFPDTKLREAWTYRFREGHWEFHGPDKFYWQGSASCAYDARYHGWMAWLAGKGVSFNEDRDCKGGVPQ